MMRAWSASRVEKSRGSTGEVDGLVEGEVVEREEVVSRLFPPPPPPPDRLRVGGVLWKKLVCCFGD